MKIERVVFMQGDNANEALEIRDNEGNQSALEYLMQWHHPNEHETSRELSAGTSDRTYTSGGYVLTYNTALGYIGLEYVLEAV